MVDICCVRGVLAWIFWRCMSDVIRDRMSWFFGFAFVACDRLLLASASISYRLLLFAFNGPQHIGAFVLFRVVFFLRLHPCRTVFYFLRPMARNILVHSCSFASYVTCSYMVSRIIWQIFYKTQSERKVSLLFFSRKKYRRG